MQKKVEDYRARKQVKEPPLLQQMVESDPSLGWMKVMKRLRLVRSALSQRSWASASVWVCGLAAVLVLQQA